MVIRFCGENYIWNIFLTPKLGTKKRRNAGTAEKQPKDSRNSQKIAGDQSSAENSDSRQISSKHILGKFHKNSENVRVCVWVRDDFVI